MQNSTIVNISEVTKRYRKENFARKADDEHLFDNLDREITHLIKTQADLQLQLNKIRKKMSDLTAEYEAKTLQKQTQIQKIEGIF